MTVALFQAQTAWPCLLKKSLCAIGKLNKATNLKNADHFLACLASVDAQNIYARYGFLKTTVEALTLKKG